MTKARVGALLLDEMHDDEMALAIGPSAELTAEEDSRLRGLWFAHRDELMLDESAGSRPWAWWRWESGLGAMPDLAVTDRRGYVVMSSGEAEIEWLRKHGHLTVFEERELKKRRQLFEDPAGAS
jgi:hypothetical protein